MPTNKSKSFKDVEMSWAEDDIEKIQNKPNLYLMKYKQIYIK